MYECVWMYLNVYNVCLYGIKLYSKSSKDRKNVRGKVAIIGKGNLYRQMKPKKL